MNTVTTILEGFNSCDRIPLNNPEVIEREFVIANTTVCFRTVVRSKNASLSDLVPLARTICDVVSGAVLCSSAENKPRVSCHKGCEACCSYLVPLSMPEVFRLKSELVTMSPTARIRILRSSLEAARKILKRDLMQPAIDTSSELKQISQWYAGLRIQCPFLSNGICTIYEQRPLVCREYFVTSTPDQCKSGSLHPPDILRLPVSIAELFGEFAAKLENSEVEAVMLPLAVIGTKEISERSQRTWPAVNMVHLFFDLLEESVTANSQKAAGSV